jgi:thiol-disulfide isomerase/thioredoxin
MYKLALLLSSLLVLFSCEDTSKPEVVEVPKDYVTFSGKITNNTADSIAILSREFSRIISVNEDGSFKDTFSLEPGTYYFTTKENGMVVFLKNGYDLVLDIDAKAFNTSSKFTGEGAKENNYLVEKANFEADLFDQDLSHLTATDLDSAIQKLMEKALNFINLKTEIDTLLINDNKADLDMIAKSLKNYYSEITRLKDEMPKGSASPTFADYENYDGTKTSLADLKGKNVYIDIWATWCGPCKAEIPALKTLEHDYEGKNIAFVSLSIDDPQAHQGSWEVANEKWRAMVKEKELGGIQLFAPEGWESPFIRAFQINSIPRFILLDTEGNIINPSAPRPSDDKLRTLLDEII